MKRMMFAILTAAMLFGCIAETHEAKLSRAGITGEHVLRHPNEMSSLTGSLIGNFFIGTGSVNGKMEGIKKIAFSWSPKPNTIVSSEFPKSMFIVVVDNDKKVPTLEFIFEKDWLSSTPFATKKADWQTENVNAIISATGELQAIRIRISEAALKNEPALPQF